LHAARPPVSPDALPSVKRLLLYLYAIGGKQTLSGMHSYPLCNSCGIEESRRANGGQYPALWGSDVEAATNNCGSNYTVQKNREQLNRDIIEQWKHGSLITLTWHQTRPGDSWDCGFKSAHVGISDNEFNAIITPGTTQHAQWLSHIDDVAKYLKKLEEANIPIQ
jgi:mannan endo-1,4-beta-mannosidase